MSKDRIESRASSKKEATHKSTRKAATIAARAGVDRDAAHGAVMPPLYLSTNFRDRKSVV